MIEFLSFKNPFSVLFALFVIGIVFLVNAIKGLRRSKIDSRDYTSSISDEELCELPLG